MVNIRIILLVVKKQITTNGVAMGKISPKHRAGAGMACAKHKAATKNNIEWDRTISVDVSNVLRYRTTIPPSALMTICHALLLYVHRGVMLSRCVDAGVHEHCMNLGSCSLLCCIMLFFVVCYPCGNWFIIVRWHVDAGERMCPVMYYDTNVYTWNHE